MSAAKQQAPPPLTISDTDTSEKLLSNEYSQVDVCFDIVSVGTQHTEFLLLFYF